MRFLFRLSLIVVLFSACMKYRKNVSDSDANTVPTNSGITFGALRINEFICKGVNTKAQTYFQGSDAKWFELYNPTNTNITLESGHWFVTDSLEIPDKFSIPQHPSGNQWVVPANGFLAIMCLKSTSIPCASKINTTFSLNSTEGAIGIFYKADSSSALMAVDTIRYLFPSGALSGVSYGRIPNGVGPMIQLADVSPESSN
jgi:hypothetical protein